MVIESQLSPCKGKGNGAHMPLREKRIPLAITKLLFNAAQEPLIASTRAGILQYFAIKLQPIIARVRELVSVKQAQKVRKLAGVAAVRGRCEEQDTLGAGGKPFGQLIAARLCDFLPPPARRASKCFADENQGPGQLRPARGHHLPPW